jgi:hypothetical protein
MKFRPLLIVALLLGLLTRGYQFRERYLYAHDGDLASWIVKDIVVDHHVRLIGQLTSAPGIFIGAAYYYLLIPFYLLTHMDPIGGIALSLATAILAILSLYYVVTKVHSQGSANISVLIYSVSDLISRTEREVVPTTPVMLWSIWCYYALFLVFTGNKKGYLLFAVLLGFVWHINLALALVTPLFILAFFYKRFKLSDLIFPLLTFVILSLPLIIFEVRHGFTQSQALISSLTSMGHNSVSLYNKVLHVISYANKNVIGLLYYKYSGLILFAFLIYSIIRSRLSIFWLFIYVGWMVLIILFFTFNSINLSEYYLNSINILWIILAGLFLAWLPKYISLPLLTLYIFVNLSLLFSFTINYSGYIEKKAIVSAIAADAKLHHYPCISVSYITSPGNNLGYRYLFYLQKLPVNSPKRGSPVYSIVFPHSLVDHLDRTFGALGLILPEYKRYNEKDISVTCGGPDENITGDMFGFTK